MKNDAEFMNRVHAEVEISLGHSAEVANAIEVEAKRAHGDDWYDHWRKAMYVGCESFKLTNVTMGYALEVAEGIRIANPDTHVNVGTGPGGDFVCNVTWNDQMKEFRNYPVYTEAGAMLKLESATDDEIEKMADDWYEDEQDFDAGAIFDGDLDPAGGYGINSHV